MMYAPLFLPSHIKLFTKRVTNLSLNFGSGANGNFLACALRMVLIFYLSAYCRKSRFILFFCFFFLGSVLATALFTVFNARCIQTAAYYMITYTWQIFY